VGEEEGDEITIALARFGLVAWCSSVGHVCM
jgi:hypothetical protein